MAAPGHERRLSDVGMSASPPTPDVWLRRSETTLRANRFILQCRKTASLFVPTPIRNVTDLPTEA